jgi:hypothetical protein
MIGNSIPENEEDHEVSDEDEAAEVQEETSRAASFSPLMYSAYNFNLYIKGNCS